MYFEVRLDPPFTNDQLIEKISECPKEKTALMLFGLALHEKTAAELAAAFKSIPPWVTRLNLRNNGLGVKTEADLVVAFAAIPKSVNSLNLSFNDFYLQTGEQLATVFKALPSSVSELDLSDNNLSRLAGVELATALKALPSSVSTVNLGGNLLGNSIGEDLAVTIGSIPKTVTTLDLSFNFLDKKTGAELATIFKVIPSSVSTLILRRNDLNKKSGAELATAFLGIPSTVTTLDLSNNTLCSMTAEKLATAFAGVPASVTTLKLSDNNLGWKTAAELETVFATIPASVTTLKLSDNNLGWKTASDLAVAFANIPASVTALDLSNNNLGGKTTAELVVAITALPKFITSLNLTGCFSKLEGHLDLKLLQIVKAKPQCLITVTLQDGTTASSLEVLFRHYHKQLQACIDQLDNLEADHEKVCIEIEEIVNHWTNDIDTIFDAYLTGPKSRLDQHAFKDLFKSVMVLSDWLAYEGIADYWQLLIENFSLMDAEQFFTAYEVVITQKLPDSLRFQLLNASCHHFNKLNSGQIGVIMNSLIDLEKTYNPAAAKMYEPDECTALDLSKKLAVVTVSREHYLKPMYSLFQSPRKPTAAESQDAAEDCSLASASHTVGS